VPLKSILIKNFQPSAVGAGDAAHSIEKKIGTKLDRFGQIWLDLGKMEAKFEQK